MDFLPRRSLFENLLPDLTSWRAELSSPGSSRVRKLVFQLSGKKQVCSVEGEDAESGKELDLICTNDFEIDGEEEKTHFAEFDYGQDPTLFMGADTQVKLKELELEFSQKLINLDMVRSIAASGLPYGGGFRATTWKLLLGYLPLDRSLWEPVLAENRSKYLRLKDELLLSPTVVSKNENKTLLLTKNSENSFKRNMQFLDDHPLCTGKGSVWNQYFQDAEISVQIDRDLPRTHPDNPIFSGDSSIVLENQGSMRRILLLFAKLNPDIGYIQGMNEVLAPLFLVFKTNPDQENALNAEADSFACFVRLMSDSISHYCQKFDNRSLGILSTLTQLTNMLRSTDEELWLHLEKLKVKPQYYAFRWVTLLLTQEFELCSVLRIWDALLSNPPGVQEMLLRVCCAMQLCVRKELLNGDFAANIKLLQHYPHIIDVEYILKVAMDINL